LQWLDRLQCDTFSRSLPVRVQLIRVRAAARIGRPDVRAKIYAFSLSTAQKYIIFRYHGRMNDSQLRRLLAERSPWRARAGWEAEDPDLRAAGRLPLDYEPEPLADIHAPGLYVLRGPRRVGKSLELKRAIARLLAGGIDPKTVFYCS